MSRVAIVCPGRGSYTEATLRSLPPEHEFVQAAENCAPTTASNRCSPSTGPRASNPPATCARPTSRP
ncbi:MAG: hypothetical protein R3E96_02795 [Planctomycetota bacterium]